MNSAALVGAVLVAMMFRFVADSSLSVTLITLSLK